MAKKRTYVTEIPVEFGNVGIGEGTARLGIKIDRARLTNLEDADEFFGGRRLTGKVTITPPGDAPGQKHLVDGMTREIESVFDVKGFTVNQKKLGLGLTFALAEIDISELAHFAKQSGWLLIESADPLEDDKDGDGDDAGTDDDDAT